MKGNRLAVGLICSALCFAGPAAAEEEATAGTWSSARDRTQLNNQSVTSKAEEAKKKEDPVYLTPSLYGLREILIQYPVFMDPRSSNECGLNREPLITVVQRNLQDPNLEIMMQNETHERHAVRAELTYEIYTARQDQICFSFVNMYFTDRASIMLPPVKSPRALTVTYWQKAMLARSPVDRHQTSVGDALAAMSRSFLRDVKLAEPATYSEQRRPQSSEEDERNERQMQMMRSINDNVSRRLLNQGGGADIPAINGTIPQAKEDDHQ